MVRLAPGYDLQELAELELTGGEIRIVVEKAVRQAAWQGERFLSQAMLLKLAREEGVGKLDQKRVMIGY
jgi:hypothetical protein